MLYVDKNMTFYRAYYWVVYSESYFTNVGNDLRIY